METPERLVWPFWPRPAVLPRPEPMPRPTRTRLLRAPWLSRISFSFIVVALAFAFVALVRSGLLRHRHHMLHLADHSADLRGIRQLDRLVHLVEAQPDQRLALVRRAADRGAGLGDLDGRHLALLRHRRGVSLGS